MPDLHGLPEFLYLTSVKDRVLLNMETVKREFSFMRCTFLLISGLQTIGNSYSK